MLLSPVLVLCAGLVEEEQGWEGPDWDRRPELRALETSWSFISPLRRKMNGGAFKGRQKPDGAFKDLVGRQTCG